MTGRGVVRQQRPTAKGLATLYLWLASFLVLQAFDIGTTVYALGNGLGSEANPLALYLYEAFGALGLTLPKIVATALIAGMMWLLAKNHPRMVAGAKTLTIGTMSLVVINNLSVIA